MKIQKSRPDERFNQAFSVAHLSLTWRVCICMGAQSKRAMIYMRGEDKENNEDASEQRLCVYRWIRKYYSNEYSICVDCNARRSFHGLDFFWSLDYDFVHFCVR